MKPTETGASRLALWFSKNCDERKTLWHSVKIHTTDNPGWLVDIDMEGTPEEGLLTGKGKRDGFTWEVSDGRLYGYDEGILDLEGLLMLLADVLARRERPEKYAQPKP